MPLSATRLASKFEQILKSNPGGDSETGIKYFSQQMAAAVIEEITTNGQITVTVDPGQAVATSSGAGSTTSPGTGRGNIS